MLKMKRLLSVALAVIMVLSTIAFSASALEEGKEFGMVLKADKTVAEIVPGETVTVTLYFEMANWSQLMSDMKICLLYDSNVYTPDLSSRQFLGDLAGYAKDSAQPNINASYATACMNASTMSAEDKATYNSGVMQQIGSDASLGATNKAGFSVTEEADGVSVAQMSIEFNVTGDAAAIAAGNINIAICDAFNSQQTIKKTTGSKTPTFISSFDASKANILANMPEAPATPVVALNKKQVKFVSDGMGGVEKDYKFRVKSVVSEADWNAFFANTNVAGETTNLVENVGIVAYKGTAGWDANTAKAVVAGTPATGYTAAETDYIQKIDGDNAYFGAIIELNSDTCDYDITFMGYVKYKDADGVSQIIFYDAEATAAVYSNYTVNVDQWISENA